MKITILILAVTPLLLPVLAARDKLASPKQNNKTQTSKAQTDASTSQCETSGTRELTITCEYTAGSPDDADRRSSPRVLLNRAVISFSPSEDGHMDVELTFTNESGSKITARRTVYLAIDGENGENHMRRPLPHADFTELEPGRVTKFHDTLVAPAFRPGRYIVSIWIPSTEPSFKFDPTHNFLLSSKNVPDRVTGLNQIAKFTVISSGGHKSAAKPD
jgi:hypothetical protein